MSTLLIRNATLILADRLLENGAVFCRNGVVEDIRANPSTPFLRADEVVDASGMYFAPGFIDLHFHGARDYRVDEGRAHLESLCRILPQYGVTGFLPGVTPADTAADDIARLASLSCVESEGTAILGFFLEGHFLALSGALPGIAENATRDRLEQLCEAVRPYRVVFAVSPELEGVLDLIPLMRHQGMPVFITHTAATVEQTEAAIRAGAVHATHFYDVFPYPGEKDPGVRACGTVEAILASPETSVDFILDGEHVAPVAVRLALACLGKDRVSLITDANCNAGMPPGHYEALGTGIDVQYEGGPARMSAGSRFPGALAGSGLTMDQAVRNAVRLLGVDLPQAVRMATANPARVLGLQDRKGSLREGHDADLILLDRALKVERTWVGGRLRYARNSSGQS